MRIRSYYTAGVSWILDYVRKHASTRFNWAAATSSYEFQLSLTQDVLFSAVQSVFDHRNLVAARAAIKRWVIAYAVSKVVLIQSVIRRWLVFKDFVTPRVSDPNPEVVAVLTVSEVISVVNRINFCSREFRVGISFSVVCDFVKLEWSGKDRSWRPMITIFDIVAMINMITESVVDKDWSYAEGNRDSWSSRSVTSIDGVKISVGGKVIVPGHSMVFNGRVMPLVATVVKSIPNQVELLIGLPVILSPEYLLLPDLASWRVYDRVAKETVTQQL